VVTFDEQDWSLSNEQQQRKVRPFVVTGHGWFTGKRINLTAEVEASMSALAVAVF
jgi:hypothetical protein